MNGLVVFIGGGLGSVVRYAMSLIFNKLENGFPLKEIYRTPDGDLTKTYSYKNGKVTDVVYLFTDLQNQTNSLKKRFEYKEMK